MQPANNSCQKTHQNETKDCAACRLCFNATEVHSRRQSFKQQETMHLYAAERKLYQFYYAEVMKRKVGKDDLM